MLSNRNPPHAGPTTRPRLTTPGRRTLRRTTTTRSEMPRAESNAGPSAYLAGYAVKTESFGERPRGADSRCKLCQCPGPFGRTSPGTVKGGVEVAK